VPVQIESVKKIIKKIVSKYHNYEKDTSLFANMLKTNTCYIYKDYLGKYEDSDKITGDDFDVAAFTIVVAASKQAHTCNLFLSFALFHPRKHTGTSNSSCCNHNRLSPSLTFIAVRDSYIFSFLSGHSSRQQYDVKGGERMALSQLYRNMHVDA